MAIDWDKPIETVEGHPARVISTDHRYSGEALVVVQIEYPGFSCVGYYHQNGEPTFGSVGIRNRKTKRERWMNIYPHQKSGGVMYNTKDKALFHARPDIIATIKIEWEE